MYYIPMPLRVQRGGKLAKKKWMRSMLWISSLTPLPNGWKVMQYLPIPTSRYYSLFQSGKIERGPVVYRVKKWRDA